MTYIEKLKAALVEQLNIVIFGGLLLFSAVTWSAIPLFIALLGEAAYLAIVPPLAPYRQRLLNRERARKQQQVEAESKKLLANVLQTDREQFSRLVGVTSDIKTNYQSLNPTTLPLLEGITAKLDGLLARYLTMLHAYRHSENYLANTRLSELESKKKEITSSIEGQSDSLREVLSKQLTVIEKRVEKHRQVEANTRVLKTQLDTIEQFIFLLKDQSFAMKEPKELNSQIDTLVAEVEGTESAVKELESFFSEQN